MVHDGEEHSSLLLLFGYPLKRPITDNGPILKMFPTLKASLHRGSSIDRCPNSTRISPFLDRG